MDGIEPRMPPMAPPKTSMRRQTVIATMNAMMEVRMTFTQLMMSSILMGRKKEDLMDVHFSFHAFSNHW